MRNSIKVLLFGILTWAVPFVISFAFYTKGNDMAIGDFLYKSVMLVVGSLTWATFMVLYFKKIKENYLKEAIRIGTAWMAINIILDLSVMSSLTAVSMSIGDYFGRIGIRYLLIPIMSTAIGLVAKGAKR